MLKNIKFVFSLFLFIFISACQTVPKYEPPSPETRVLWQKNQTQLNQLKSWKLNGRIAILAPEEHLTLNVHWQQLNEVYILRFTVPPGQGAFLLQGDDEGVVMHTSNDETFTARNPNTLVKKILKIEVPVANLHAWIRGIPVLETDVIEYRLDSEGNLTYLEQSDWKITYKSYTDVANTKLPRKLFLENEKEDLEVRIVISNWDIEDGIFVDMQ